MAALTRLVGLRTDRTAPLVVALGARIGTALGRAARARYAEQRGRVERTGTAGMI